MLHAVQAVDRIGVGGLPAGGDAAALIDGHIHHHRARPHLPHQFFAHQRGGAAAGGEYGADQQVGFRHQTLDQAGVADQAD